MYAASFSGCFGGWGKGEPDEARGGGGGPARAGVEGTGGGSSRGASCTGFTLVIKKPSRFFFYNMFYKKNVS
jgi:hypothetical protein